MKILNLGCGTKTSSRPEVVNIDWSVMLRIRRNSVLRSLAPILLKGDRLARFHSLPDNVEIHNLARGIPYLDDSFDVVYHSHLLEHLDRDVAPRFLAEVHRVLKPGGLHRIVVPDYELACRAYLTSLERSLADHAAANGHEDSIALLVEQSVRREAAGTSLQSPARRCLENLVLGDARQRGETHQWAYDRVNLGELLRRTGHRDCTVHAFDTSSIPGWIGYGLDSDAHGGPHQPGSLYVEALK